MAQAPWFLAVGEVEIEVGEHDHHEQHDVGDGGALACLVLLVGDADQVVGDRHRVVAALGQQDHKVGQLEGLDGAEQQRQHQEPADIGEGDAPEAPPGGDPVDRGRLVEIFRHGHEARQHQQHDEGRPHPGIGENDAGHGAGLAVHEDELAARDAIDHIAQDAEGRDHSSR